MNVLKSLSAAGMILMAATPLVSIASLAHASQRVQVGDLSTPEGSAAFKSRIDDAAHRVCAARGDKGLGAMHDCQGDVWAEVTAQIDPAQAGAVPVSIATAGR